MVVANLKGSSFIEDATATRPNCFALRRQVMILQKAGGGSAERQAAETRCKKRKWCVQIWLRDLWLPYTKYMILSIEHVNLPCPSPTVSLQRLHYFLVGHDLDGCTV